MVCRVLAALRSPPLLEFAWPCLRLYHDLSMRGLSNRSLGFELQRDQTVLRSVFEVAIHHMPSFKVLAPRPLALICKKQCSKARWPHPSPRDAMLMQMFPKIDRANPQGSAADYVRFVTSMYVASRLSNPCE
jgi:hypothetical protein